MANSTLLQSVRERYKYPISAKAGKYVNAFYAKSQTPTMIKAKVEGNHGEYAVSIKLKENLLTSACSCYIGKYGGCHHCEALGIHYLQNPDSFSMKKAVKKAKVNTLETLQSYLESVTLEDLVAQLKKKGISQKAFAKSIGMSSSHLSAVKRAENRNRYFHELGATKLACVWVLEKMT